MGIVVIDIIAVRSTATALEEWFLYFEAWIIPIFLECTFPGDTQDTNDSSCEPISGTSTPNYYVPRLC